MDASCNCESSSKRKLNALFSNITRYILRRYGYISVAVRRLCLSMANINYGFECGIFAKPWQSYFCVFC